MAPIKVKKNPTSFYFKSHTYSRIYPIISFILFLTSLLFPYWLFIMDAPTYPEKDLTIAIYADRLAGDLKEWGTVSKLVGIKVPPPTPELDLKIVPLITIILAVLSFISAFKGKGWIKLTVVASWLTLASLSAWMQYRLYIIGHDLDPTAPLRGYVKPFTPPIIGWVTVGGKITVYHWPYIGSILFLVATLLITVLLIRSRRR
jgi:hypothetical protein